MVKLDKLQRDFTSKVRKVDVENHIIESIITTDTTDRYNEIIIPSGIQTSKYRKNPVVLWAHDTSIPAVGKNIDIKIEGSDMIAKTKFANTDFANELFDLYKDGYINAFSIGFLPLKWEDGDGTQGPDRTYHEIELLEYSLVNIPANPDALGLAMSKGMIKTKEVADLLNVKLPDPTPDTEIDEKKADIIAKEKPATETVNTPEPIPTVFLEITPPPHVLEITPDPEITFDFTYTEQKSNKKEDEINITETEIKKAIDESIKSAVNETVKAIVQEIKYNLGKVD